jgi:hypothetical protein
MMQRFTVSELSNLQAHIDLTEKTVGRIGLTMNVSTDMARFIEYLRNEPAKDTHGTPTTHDPKLSHLHPGNSFWVYLEDARGEIVACHGQRFCETRDFINDCLRQTYFQDLTPKIHQDSLELYPEANGIDLRGRLAFGGGLYIRREWRGKDLLIFNRCSRTLALRHFDADYVVGTLRNTPNRKGMALGNVAYAECCRFVKGSYPGKPESRDTIVAWSSRWQLLQTIAQEVEAPCDDIQTQVLSPDQPRRRAAGAAAHSPA